MNTVSAFEAKTHMGKLLDRVANGEEFEVGRVVYLQFVFHRHEGSRLAATRIGDLLSTSTCSRSSNILASE